IQGATPAVRVTGRFQPPLPQDAPFGPGPRRTALTSGPAQHRRMKTLAPAGPYGDATRARVPHPRKRATVLDLSDRPYLACLSPDHKVFRTDRTPGARPGSPRALRLPRRPSDRLLQPVVAPEHL